MNIHHEEMIIKGILNYRKSFKDEWKPYNLEELTKMVSNLQKTTNNVLVNENKIIKTKPRLVSESFNQNTNNSENVFKRFIRCIKDL